jgi:hypothetical protein
MLTKTLLTNLYSLKPLSKVNIVWSSKSYLNLFYIFKLFSLDNLQIENCFQNTNVYSAKKTRKILLI